MYHIAKQYRAFCCYKVKSTILKVDSLYMPSKSPFDSMIAKLITYNFNSTNIDN